MCNYHIGDNYYSQVLSAINILVVVGIDFDILKWRNFMLHQWEPRPSSQVTHQVDRQTRNDAFSLIGDSLKWVSPTSKWSKKQIQWNCSSSMTPCAPVTFRVKEKVSPAPGSKYKAPTQGFKLLQNAHFTLFITTLDTYLETVAWLGLLPDNIQHWVNKLGSWKKIN